MASKQYSNTFIFYFFLSLHLSHSKSQTLNTETDRLSLLSFKQSITDDPFQTLTSWNDSTPLCQWRGITCSSRRARVTTLTLPSLKLGGTLSPSIANLTFLKIIDLRENNFRGHIPSDMGCLYRLEHLFLMQNSFGGEIPANLSRCSSLKVMNLNFNSLVGKIPTEFTSLQNLIALHISANHLTGGIPLVLGNISSLLNLSIAQNILGGVIPENLGRLVNLRFLQIGNNNLSSSVPDSVFNLSGVSIFALALNNLEGSFPASLGAKLPNLKHLLVGVNHFSGGIPPTLSNISGLQIIDFPDNRFSGRVPNDLGRLKDLQRLNVGRNLLGGPGPGFLDFIESLTNCSKFQMLSLDSNYFSGLLPRAIVNLSIEMSNLQLGGNRLSGQMPPGLTNLINLNMLNVSWNGFDGQISPDIGKLSGLRRLFMNNNRFSGKIPSGIGNLTKLIELRLDRNGLENVIPASLGNFRELKILNLSSNNLSGVVPLEIFTISSLTVSLNLGRNSLSGNLPEDIGNFRNLRELDLSDNEFSGRIPESLSRCSSLEFVFLHANVLNGSIPLSLSVLKGIQDLDLSKNNLTGNIPRFLEDFVFLRYLNLSFNRLNGEVPKNGVFSNKSAVLLDGNGELCGGNIEFELPLCGFTANSVGRRKTSRLKIVIGTVFGVSGAFVILYVAIYCILKRWRGKSVITLASYEFSYGELEKATNGFSEDNLVGEGGFASVYRGSRSENGKYIAVKVLNRQENGASKSYLAECEALRNIKHRNLVKILGCCSDRDNEGRDFKAIVLEFVPNGSLDKWLHPDGKDYLRVHNNNNSNNSLDFLKRLNVAIDVASALEYLHYYCHVPVVHCDLKPGNVLVDNEFCAHLSDFGLARFLRKHAQAQTQSSSIGIRGSIEYWMGRPTVSISRDVYSFGILLLEMFTGKRPTDDLFREGSSLHMYAKNALLTNNVIDILDPNLIDEQEKVKQCLVLIVRIGVTCSRRLRQERMDMKDANLKLQLIRNTLLEK
ncbi:probable LRR receptor-like serine/threonine-protein kinase at3g47570 [Phtheirospermum japonicum]|uniref:non-specific serine/threonine protein kinase n=1 Tax=Phtheirospermum japonicum TaxID=374723 RepID=A0A830CW42_9LAMI|nr:probable LRR receptor-like serine/threonine-protein kinase at3g47570 [Phtheirospermum japonicum]